MSRMARGKSYYFLITHHIWKLETCILAWNDSYIVAETKPIKIPKIKDIAQLREEVRKQGEGYQANLKEPAFEKLAGNVATKDTMISFPSDPSIQYQSVSTHPLTSNTAYNSLFPPRLLGFRRPQPRWSRLLHHNRTRQRRTADLFFVPARPRKRAETDRSTRGRLWRRRLERLHCRWSDERCAARRHLRHPRPQPSPRR